METAPTTCGANTPPPLKVFLVAGEHSGDALGAPLMRALREQCAGLVAFTGVGGELMEAEGLHSLFPMADVAVMGILAILRRLPTIVRRVHQTVAAAVAAAPDVVVIIDSPEFTHPIAQRIRRQRPDIPILDYVSPTVWAWRPGRARKMKPYVDHVLALLPFEPAAHGRLGGPACSYVGHPLIARRAAINALDPGDLARRLGLSPQALPVVLLPGSRASEAGRLLPVFAATIALLARARPDLVVLLPVVSTLRDVIARETAGWPVRPHLIEGENDKWRAFRLARAALAASGTVTLELALAGTPMVVAYKVDPVMAPVLRRAITSRSVVLANLILDDNVFPECLQEDCTPDGLASLVGAILDDGPARAAQLAGLARILAIMDIPGADPSAVAAGLVLGYARQGRAFIGAGAS